MRSGAEKSLRASLLLCSGLVLAVGVLVAGPLALLWTRKAEIAALQAEIDDRQATVESQPPCPDYATSLREMQAALEDWQSLAENEALRLAELAKVAQASGAVLAGFQALDGQQSREGRIVSCPYRLSLRGSFEQVAAFCDALYAARGLVAIDELELKPETSGGPGQLEASLQIAWYAPAQAATSGEENPLP